MAALSDIIEIFIKEQFKKEESIEIKRNEMALQFQCAPSQINYVLSSRFTIENGYAVQSRRGGGGYVRIIRLALDDKNEYVLHVLQLLHGEQLTYKEALRLIEGLRQRELLSEREAAILMGVMDPQAFEDVPESMRDLVRSKILKSALQVLMKKAACHLCASCRE